MFDDTAQQLSTPDFHKTGASNADILEMQKMYAAGATPEQISQQLRIVLSCVESFAPEKLEELKAKGEELQKGVHEKGYKPGDGTGPAVPEGAEAFAKVAGGKHAHRSK